jgi:hypothetical protein
MPEGKWRHLTLNTCGGSGGITPSFLTLPLGRGGCPACPCDLTPPYHCIKSWVCLRDGLEDTEKRKTSCFCRESNPYFPVVQTFIDQYWIQLKFVNYVMKWNGTALNVMHSLSASVQKQPPPPPLERHSVEVYWWCRGKASRILNFNYSRRWVACIRRKALYLLHSDQGGRHSCSKSSEWWQVENVCSEWPFILY